MDADAFRLNGHALVEWIATYLENTEQYPVLSRNRPGELRAQLPTVAPKSGVPFDTILKDFEKLILPGITQDFLVISQFPEVHQAFLQSS